MSFASPTLDDPLPDTIPLSNAEKIRKEQLERIVSDGLAKFLEVGAALTELRNKRLYRTEFSTFEAYVQARFLRFRWSLQRK